MSREELAYLLSKYDRKKKYIRLKNGDFLNIEEDGLSTLAEVSEDLRLTETNLKKRHFNCTKIPRNVSGRGIKEQSASLDREK